MVCENCQIREVIDEELDAMVVSKLTRDVKVLRQAHKMGSHNQIMVVAYDLERIAVALTNKVDTRQS